MFQRAEVLLSLKLKDHAHASGYTNVRINIYTIQYCTVTLLQCSTPIFSLVFYIVPPHPPLNTEHAMSSSTPSSIIIDRSTHNDSKNKLIIKFS